MATPGRDIKLLLSDVDGTLVTRERVLTPAARAAARALRQAGIGLALTSARPPRGLRMLIEPLDLQLPLAGFNGGLIVDTAFRFLESHPLPPDAASAAVDLMAAAGLDIWVYTEDAWHLRDRSAWHVEREAGIIGMEPQVVATFDPPLLSRAFKIVGVSEDHDLVTAVAAVAQAALGSSVSATRSTAYFLDVTHPKATKGGAVHFLAAHLGLSPAQIATIGDMHNDLPMFREGGLSIAMGNAAAEVKAQADLVTASNEDDGFAKAVARFILEREAAG